MKTIAPFALLLLVACTRRQEPAPPTTVVAEPLSASDAAAATATDTAPADGAAKVNVPWTGAPPKAWTDARVVAALAQDCDFVPPAGDGPRDIDGHPADLLHCTLPYQQSCAYAPCHDVGEQCKTDCGKACLGCGTTCSDGCRTCKAGCSDDACRKACASTCAQCKETCARALDRCASGTCAKAQETCSAELRAAYAKNGCGPVCEKAMACETRCANQRSSAKTGEDCASCNDADRTFSACSKGCPQTIFPVERDAKCDVACIVGSGCSTLLCSAGRPR